VRIRHLAAPLILASLCLAQGTWQTATDLPGVDWQGLTGAKKQVALEILRTESCTCGCSMKMAECRMKDPSCGISHKLSNVVIKDVAANMKVEEVRLDVKKIAGEPPPILEDAVKISLAGDPVKGPDKARVTLVEFSDFQCPFCTRAVGITNDIMKMFPNDVKFVFKQFPLDTHSEAEFGAEAALAAQAQGKFWEMHDRLYAGFPDISRNRVMGYAKQIGLDVNRFTADLDSHKFAARVHAEENEGINAGVSGTPTFYINGRKYNGVYDAEVVAPLIKQALK
jgi:protein-disulfide isomerase